MLLHRSGAQYHELPLAPSGTLKRQRCRRRTQTIAQGPGRWVACAQDHQPAVVVVGGGAAGLTAAYFAATHGAKVTVLERCAEAGKKILISGGTRSNVLPFAVDVAADYVSESSPSALRAVFATWTLSDCKDWLEQEIGIPLAAEEETEKWFPVSNSAREVRDKLIAACARQNVQIRHDASVENLGPAEGPNRWVCGLVNGSSVAANRLVIATGGLSFPKMGTDGTGHRFLQQAGHNLAPVYPALTPLTGGHPAAHQLAGISLPHAVLTASAAQAAGGKKRGRGMKPRRTAFLFTHRGFSGPAVLDLSHAVSRPLDRGQPLPNVRVNWTGEGEAAWADRLTAGGPGLVTAAVRQAGVPSRLADALVAAAGLPPGRSLSELRKAERLALLATLTSCPLSCDGHEGFAKAEVTGGGIPLEEIDCRSMESRLLPGVHLCGEVLDVFGRLGGFNFYWAWLTGRAAGLHAAGKP